VVTVSIGVLAAEAIRFAPRLPDPVLRAIDAVPLGRAEKVHLAFDRDPFPELPHHYRLCGDGGEALAFHVKPFGRAMVTLFSGGDAAGALGALAPADRVAFARERLAAEFGAEAARRVTAARPTGWAADERVRGAYGVTRPGRFADRRGFDEAPGGRLFFAGEACSARSFGTAHGADETGVAAARRAAAAIRGEERP
jgi:monoamine oxidase